jgi:hypothetical protein
MFRSKFGTLALLVNIIDKGNYHLV